MTNIYRKLAQYMCEQNKVTEELLKEWNIKFRKDNSMESIRLLEKIIQNAKDISLNIDIESHLQIIVQKDRSNIVETYSYDRLIQDVNKFEIVDRNLKDNKKEYCDLKNDFIQVRDNNLKRLLEIMNIMNYVEGRLLKYSIDIRTINNSPYDRWYNTKNISCLYNINCFASSDIKTEILNVKHNEEMIWAKCKSYSTDIVYYNHDKNKPDYKLKKHTTVKIPTSYLSMDDEQIKFEHAIYVYGRYSLRHIEINKHIFEEIVGKLTQDEFKKICEDRDKELLKDLQLKLDE